MNMVMIALRDGRRFQDLLKAIRQAGAHSATILDTDGLDVLVWRGIRGALEPPAGQEGSGKTILTVVPDALTAAVIEAAEHILVGFSGTVCAWSVGHAAVFQGERRPTELARRFA